MVELCERLISCKFQYGALKTFELFSIIDSESKLELWLIFILIEVKQINKLPEALLYIWDKNTISVFLYLSQKGFVNVGVENIRGHEALK